MPYKHNAGKRHHIPEARYAVTNWPEYEAGLKRRGSLTLWLTPEAIAQWKAPARTTPGGQPRYSDLAIQTGLILRTAFRLPLRQAEGLMDSVFSLMHLALAVPDHTTLSHRAAAPSRAARRRACSYSHRQYWAEGLRCRSVAGRKTRHPGQRDGHLALIQERDFIHADRQCRRSGAGESPLRWHE